MMPRILAIVVVLLALKQQPGVGTIEVTVRDDINRLPLQNVRIQLSYTGDSSASDGLSATTDAAGHVAFINLPYGEYGLRFERSGYVLSSASPRLVLHPDRPMANLEVALGSTAAMMGRILTSSGNPLEDAEVSAVPVYYPEGTRKLGRPQGGAGITSRIKTNAKGEFRLSGLWPGEYYIRVDQSARLKKDNTHDEFVRLCYFPGVVDSASAVSITLQGQDVSGIDIRMPDVPTFKISGTVLGAVPETDSNGNPYQGFNFVSSDPDSLEEPVLISSRATRGKAPDEVNFEIAGIPPGSYFLYPLFQSSGAPGSNYSTRQIPVTVDDDDVTELRILARPTAEINGRVTIKGDASRITSNNLRLQAISVTPLLLTGNRVTAPVSDSSFEFTLKGLNEDELYTLFVNGLPANTFIADIRQGAISVLHDGAIRASSAYGKVEVLIDTRGGGLQGVVRDALNQPVGGTDVVLIPPAAYRGNPLFHKRVRADAEGRFSLDGIGPGEYSLLAFPTLPPGRPERNERFMTPYYFRGTSVTIPSNSVAQVELRVVLLQ